GCAAHADRMLAHMTEADRGGVQALLTMFRFLPRFAVRAVVGLTERQHSFPEPVAGVLRLVNLGIKGVVMTLYYSGIDEGDRVHRALHWDAKVVERPETDA